MKRIAICDDIQEIASSMQSELQEHTFDEKIVVDAFVSGSELFLSATKCQYDIIFMDIELCPEDQTGDNGMILSNKIKNLYPEVVFIFFTGNPGYEAQLLNFEPFRYINKPVRGKQLICAVEDAINRINNWEQKNFYFKKNRVTYSVKLKNILYFSSARPYIQIKTFDDHMTFRGKMDDVEMEVLQQTEDFYRVGKGYLVNLMHVKKYAAKEIEMETGERIPVSRKYMKNLVDRMSKEGKM